MDLITGWKLSTKTKIKSIESREEGKYRIRWTKKKHEIKSNKSNLVKMAVLNDFLNFNLKLSRISITLPQYCTPIFHLTIFIDAWHSFFDFSFFIFHSIHFSLFDWNRLREKWSWSLSLRLVYPVLHKPPGATITSRSAVRIRINFWRMVGLYISFGDWANALECWRSPSLRLVIPGIAVSPGVTHSDSRIVFQCFI